MLYTSHLYYIQSINIAYRPLVLYMFVSMYHLLGQSYRYFVRPRVLLAYGELIREQGWLLEYGEYGKLIMTYQRF